MSEYRLQADEVQLYVGDVTYCDKNGKPLTKGTNSLMLTNQNIIFTIRTKKMFSKEEVNVEYYPVSDIKMYNNIPQVKQHGDMVTIFLTSSEKYISFPSKAEAWKFVTHATELLTGQTMVERGAGKLRTALNLVDDTLGINTVDAVKNVIENGVTGFLFGKKKK